MAKLMTVLHLTDEPLPTTLAKVSLANTTEKTRICAWCRGFAAAATKQTRTDDIHTREIFPLATPL